MSAYAVIVGGFAVIFLAVVVTDLATRRPGSRIAPLGIALTAAMRTTVGRLIMLTWWVWLGYHFLAR